MFDHDYRRLAVEAAYASEGQPPPFDVVVQGVVEPAPVDEPAPVVQGVVEPAPVVQGVVEPAPVDAPAEDADHPETGRVEGKSNPMRGIDPIRCRAKAKQRGEQCRKFAVPGAYVCRYHGGLSPQALRKAAQRAAIVEAVNDLSMFGGQRRHPWEVLVDVHHSADVLLQRAKARVETGEASGADFIELVDSMDRAMKYARTVIDTDIADKVARSTEREAQLIAFVLNRMLAVLDLTEEEEIRARGAASEALLLLDDARQGEARRAVEAHSR